jgi:hypothetical protein
MTQTFRFVVEIPDRSSVHDVKNALTSIGARVLFYRVVAKRDPNSTVALDLLSIKTSVDQLRDLADRLEKKLGGGEAP